MFPHSNNFKKFSSGFQPSRNCFRNSSFLSQNKTTIKHHNNSTSSTLSKVYLMKSESIDEVQEYYELIRIIQGESLT